MICCDKCKQEIRNCNVLNNGVITEKKNKVSFHIERFVSNDMGGVFQDHDLVLDLCPCCQEEIIKQILGYLPWAEGK